MNHEKFDKTIMDMAHCMAKMSNCVKYQVGCIITLDTRIISTGYNGTPSGYTNCCDVFLDFDMLTEINRIEHRQWSADFEIHAEMNAIIHAAKHGIHLKGAVLYCTMQPCHNCLKHIVQSGIVEVLYDTPHGKYTNNTQMMLDLTNVKVRSLNS